VDEIRRRPRIVVAGTGSGVGKTTATIGIMRALQRRGLKVQGFKCGPDYIDPTYHTAVTGRPSRNVDAWLAGEDGVRETFERGAADADVSIIEGVMGMFDGRDVESDDGSTAHIAEVLAAPVLLVVDVSGTARSAAAVVHGFRTFGAGGRIAGVLANRCGSRGHYELVKRAVEAECGVPVVGWLGADDELGAPERHLGLVPAVERGELAGWFDRLAETVERGVDLDALLALARGAEPLPAPASEVRQGAAAQADGPVIAVAKDAAFHFYYPENLELLERLGAKLVTFRPLDGEGLPDEADGVYLGGGFPEEYAERLAANRRLPEQLRALAPRGLPIVAECGGYMYLCRSITDRSGRKYPMAGIVPADVAMQPKLAAIGYREATAKQDCVLLAEGESIRGHEFHYSRIVEADAFPRLYESAGRFGASLDGFAVWNVAAGYTHFYLPSNPRAAERWVAACAAYRATRKGGAPGAPHSI